MVLNKWIEKIGDSIPVSYYQILFRKSTAAFFYHTVSDDPIPHIQHLYSYKSQKMFENDLNYLLNGHQIISYQQLLDYYQSGTSLKVNSVWISFDDGLRECLTIVRPLLIKYQIPCTFFMTTDFIDNKEMFYRHKVSLCISKMALQDNEWRRYVFDKIQKIFGVTVRDAREFLVWVKSLGYPDQEMISDLCNEMEIDVEAYLADVRPYLTSDEIRALKSEGFTIGAHSRAHPLLRELPPASSDCDLAASIECEIVESCRKICEITDVDTVPFAFPFYGSGVPVELIKDIRSKNKEVGLIFDTDGIGQYGGEVINRIWADPPNQDGSSQTNLPELLHNSYREVFFERLKGLGLYE